MIHSAVKGPLCGIIMGSISRKGVCFLLYSFGFGFKMRLRVMSGHRRHIMSLLPLEGQRSSLTVTTEGLNGGALRNRKFFFNSDVSDLNSWCLFSGRLLSASWMGGGTLRSQCSWWNCGWVYGEMEYWDPWLWLQHCSVEDQRRGSETCVCAAGAEKKTLAQLILESQSNTTVWTQTQAACVCVCVCVKLVKKPSCDYSGCW